MDTGATNEAIMTDGGQHASFSRDGSSSRGTMKGLGRGSGPLLGPGVLGSCHALEGSVLAPSFLCLFSSSDHLEASDLGSSYIRIPSPPNTRRMKRATIFIPILSFSFARVTHEVTEAQAS